MNKSVREVVDTPARLVDGNIETTETWAAKISLKPFRRRAKDVWKTLGPGLVTGASDDDASGIAIYSQVGAVSGFQLLWTALLTFPLMAVVQEMCARIGLVTGKGLAGNIRTHYPRWAVIIITTLVVAGNTLNIGADIAAVAATTNLLIPVPPAIIAIVFTALMMLLVVFTSYKTLANIFKWIALSLLVYLIIPFVTNTDWAAALQSTVWPRFTINKESLLLIVAVFGTTISPYLFFWQTSMEVEDKTAKIKRLFTRWIVTRHELKDMKEDVTSGMFLSNLVMWFIIVAAAVTLNANGLTNILTVEDAASALRPIAGAGASLIFSLGIISVSFLAIPVLAGASSYALAETFDWREGMNKTFHQAKQFYAILLISMLVGLLIPLLGIDPIRALFYTGVFYGITAPILIFAILHIANNQKVMGRYTNSRTTNFLGYAALVIMAVAVLALLFV